MEVTIRNIIQVLENFAPPALQTSYDNAALMCGEPHKTCSGVLCTLDITEAVIEEAAAKGCNLIVAHHPIWFTARKRLNGEDMVSRCLLMAIRKDIALYAIHTNLDHVHAGVNHKICQVLGIERPQILDPKYGILMKLVTYAPLAATAEIVDALFAAGAGSIGNYDSCAFISEGTGSYRPLPGSNPFQGAEGIREVAPEQKIEVVFPAWHKDKVLAALRSAHPYEEVAYQIFKTENAVADFGSGMIGDLSQPVSKADFLKMVKERFHCGVIRYADSVKQQIQRVAVCGGSGSFLIPQAMRAGADALITADITYHTFFDAESKMMLLDIGHYESEQFTPLILHAIMSEKFPNFALHLSGIRTNPIQYY
jgi:dinuclear metal center YbgI/SA1388 family protein